MSRYQRTDRSISDTNTITFGVVGAAVVHGPSSASACRAKKQSLNKHITKEIDLDEAQHHRAADKSGPGRGVGSPTGPEDRREVECDGAGPGIPAPPGRAKLLTVPTFETPRTPKRHDVFHVGVMLRSGAMPPSPKPDSVRPAACHHGESRPPKKERRPRAPAGPVVLDANPHHVKPQMR